MVKVNGPMFSLGASGSLGKAITFAIWKGRAYVRQLVEPANPKKDKQLSVRAMMKFLSQQWVALSAFDQATFEDPADADVVSPFNAYVKMNLQFWRNFLGIAQTYDPARTLTNATAGTAAATNGVRMVTVTMPIIVADDSWCLMIFRKTGGAVTPSFDTLVAVLPLNSTNDIVFVDTPLEPATYHYNFHLCTDQGKFELEDQPVNATASA